MRIDVAFDAGGTTLRGWLYTPDDGSGPFPAVVMAHGFSAVKEMGLDEYAEVFAAAGLAALVYDHRNLGASDGEPRFDIDPGAQMRDYRHAVTYAASRAEIDAERIGLWGTSYSGGLVIIAGAIDRRVRCVVSQVPYLSGWETMRQVKPIDEHAAFHRMLERERQAIAAGKPPSTVAICTDDPSKPPSAPGRRTYRYFHDYVERKGAPWKNEVTIRSLDHRLEYEALPFVPRVSPTPLLMIVATDDDVTPTDLALRAYASALEPKKLVLIAGDHYHPYLGAFAASSAAARDWLVEHLTRGRESIP